MDAVDREELIGLLTEAPMRDVAFRPHRRRRGPAPDRGTDSAAGPLVEHLYRCGIRWSRLPPRAAPYNIRISYVFIRLFRWLVEILSLLRRRLV